MSYSINEIAKDMDGGLFNESYRGKNDLIKEEYEEQVEDEFDDEDLVDLDDDADEDTAEGKDDTCVHMTKDLTVKLMKELVANCPQEQEECFAFIDALGDKLHDLCVKAEDELDVDDWESIEQSFIDEGLIEYDATEAIEGHDAPDYDPDNPEDTDEEVEDEYEEEEESYNKRKRKRKHKSDECEEEYDIDIDDFYEYDDEHDYAKDYAKDYADKMKDGEYEYEDDDYYNKMKDGEYEYEDDDYYDAMSDEAEVDAYKDMDYNKKKYAFEHKVPKKVAETLHKVSGRKLKFGALSESTLKFKKGNVKTLKESCKRINEKQSSVMLKPCKNKNGDLFVKIKKNK